MSKINRGLACALAAGLVAGQVATSQAASVAIHIHADHAMFQVLISPGNVGADSFVLQLMSGDGSRLKAKQATLYLSLPERGIEAKALKAALGADGYWHVADVPIAYPGHWHVRVEGETDKEKISLE